MVEEEPEAVACGLARGAVPHRARQQGRRRQPRARRRTRWVRIIINPHSYLNISHIMV